MKHQFESGFAQAVTAHYPFAFRALMLSAVEFTEGVLLWNVLDELVENTVRKTDGRFAVTPHGSFSEILQRSLTQGIGPDPTGRKRHERDSHHSLNSHFRWKLCSTSHSHRHSCSGQDHLEARQFTGDAFFHSCCIVWPERIKAREGADAGDGLAFHSRQFLCLQHQTSLAGSHSWGRILSP